ncbi:MAG: adenylyl-sulfate kinase [Gemmatimonadota bacterium]
MTTPLAPASEDTGPVPTSQVELLRFTTAGSVDDGKSTLIGRLLHDTRSIFEDQLEQVEGVSRRRGTGELDLALLTDGLRDEREQRITIDVAYRYFATPKRRFIIADTPGHLQYTRNMVTGASTAQLAVILIDASRGILTQSRRHAFISTLLGISHLVVAVNKMDLVGYRREVFHSIQAEFRNFAQGLEGVRTLSFVPISALKGDHVVERSRRMDWHEGPTLLELLEIAEAGTRRDRGAFRFPVQSVIRPNANFRGYAGTVVSGSIAAGDQIVVLPSGETTAIHSIETADGPLESAEAGLAVVLTTHHELDISRGDLISHAQDPPPVGSRLAGDLCWMDREPLEPGRTYLLLHATRQIQVRVDRIVHRVEIDSLGHEEADTLGLNEIGRVELSTAAPFAFDLYRTNPATGSFVLVDLRTNQTAGAGMIRRRLDTVRRVSPGAVWQEAAVPQAARESRNGHLAAVLWLTGISGAGKSSIARDLERLLFRRGIQTALLDGDRLRHGLSGDLGFSDSDRAENLRRSGEVARILFDHGAIVLAAFISPRRADRERVRGLIPPERFFEVHVHAPLEVARARDPKGLYRREREGAVGSLPGSRGLWEPPTAPELLIDTTRATPAEAARSIVVRLEEAGILPPDSAQHPRREPS